MQANVLFLRLLLREASLREALRQLQAVALRVRVIAALLCAEALLLTALFRQGLRFRF